MKNGRKHRKINKLVNKPDITNLIIERGGDVQGLFIDLTEIEDAANKLTVEYDDLICHSTDQIILTFLFRSDFETVRNYITLQEQTDFKLLTPTVIREYKAIHSSLYKKYEATHSE